MSPRPAFRQVPNIAQVVPGAHVHIVLKQDQPTGRTVQGVVQTVLTRGNHPRGIKVRLTDGRVGRVQSLDDGKLTSAQAAQPAEAGSSRALAQVRDVRFDEWGNGAPQEQIGLDAYIRPAKPKKQQKWRPNQGDDGEAQATTTTTGEGGRAAVAAETQALTTCPVCGDFEGDEAAVSHHVASHFDT